MTMKKYIVISLIILSMIVGCKENIKYVNNPDDNTTIINDGGESEDNETIINDGTGADETTDTNETNTDETLLRKANIKVEVEPHNWFIRLNAEDVNRGLQTYSAQLGVLENEEESLKHTLVSLGHFTGTYLDIVFVDPDNVESGIYKTNYKLYQEGSEYRWQFTVRSDDVNSEISLSWRGLYALTPYIDGENRKRYSEQRTLTNPLIGKMILVDTVTGTEMNVENDGVVITYTFNMNGEQERTFEWIVKTEKVNTLAKRTSYTRVQASTAKVKKQPMKTTIIENRAMNFDLAHPPIGVVDDN